MSIPKMTNDLAVIQKLSDLPNSTEGLTADQLKAKFDEAPLAIQKWINEMLVPAIIAVRIPFSPTTEINADNIDAAIREVQSQVKDASSGTIVNGSVTTEKLSPELLERVYGGRPYVSMDSPTAGQNPTTDFPVGQIWLRPSFTVVNEDKGNWTASGCTVAAGENKVTVTGNNTVTTASITEALSGIGQMDDRVMVLFAIGNKDSEITGLTISLNGGEEQDASSGVFEGVLLANGAMTIKLSATWPSTSLAGGSFEIINFAVVNLDKTIRQTTDTKPISDWSGYLGDLLPLSNYTSPEEVFIQTINGSWWPVGKQVYPVERGGTGLNTIGSGELLVGGDGNTMERLATAAEDNSFLMFSGGKPEWRTKDDAINTLGSLQIVTGSYQGTGSTRTFDLPVTPKLLHISSPNGCSGNSYSFMGTEWADHPITLAQGCADTGQYEVSVGNGTSIRSENAKLSGSSVTVGAYLCNRSGITYNWVAIY